MQLKLKLACNRISMAVSLKRDYCNMLGVG
jgi:hypothetical protein